MDEDMQVQEERRIGRTGVEMSSENETRQNVADLYTRPLGILVAPYKAKHAGDQKQAMVAARTVASASRTTSASATAGPEPKNLIVPNPFARWNKSRRSAWEAGYEKKDKTKKWKNIDEEREDKKKKMGAKAEKWFLSTYKKKCARDILPAGICSEVAPTPLAFSTTVSASLSRFAC
jgi:hypothetical protein